MEPDSPRSYWEHFPHQADIGVRGVGPSLSAAFEQAQAAVALVEVVLPTADVRPRQVVEIRCEAPDEEILLVDWLNAVIHEMATRNMLFGRFQVAVEGQTLQALAWGEPVSLERHDAAVEVKGATFTGLRVVCPSEGSWIAECVVDV
ncbi:MAG: archease [Deltaproteobacteria bacterium]|nr:archease [Deltaproteobacteria bacterium]